MYVVQSALPWTEEERASILAHLEKLRESPPFSGSRRRQAFPRYAVEPTLAGNGASIKERSVAIDVFQRTDDFDAQSASIVRVTGSEIRKRLAQRGGSRAPLATSATGKPLDRRGEDFTRAASLAAVCGGRASDRGPCAAAGYVAFHIPQRSALAALPQSRRAGADLDRHPDDAPVQRR